jgi:hypothetical protein
MRSGQPPSAERVRAQFSRAACMEFLRDPSVAQVDAYAVQMAAACDSLGRLLDRPGDPWARLEWPPTLARALIPIVVALMPGMIMPGSTGQECVPPLRMPLHIPWPKAPGPAGTSGTAGPDGPDGPAGPDGAGGQAAGGAAEPLSQAASPAAPLVQAPGHAGESPEAGGRGRPGSRAGPLVQAGLVVLTSLLGPADPLLAPHRWAGVGRLASRDAGRWGSAGIASERDSCGWVRSHCSYQQLGFWNLYTIYKNTP